MQLEDHFMNAPDDLEIRRKMCSRLPIIEIIRTTKVFDVANQAHDVEITDLEELMRLVLIYTK